MEVILREHVDNLGKRGEVVKVAPGYARNYLLPRKLALPVNDGNRKLIDRRKIQLAEPLKALGETTVPIKLHRDVTAQLKVTVAKQ